LLDLCVGLTYCHSAANGLDQTMFLFTTASASTTGACPPDCGTQYDLHSLEEEELSRVTQIEREVGIQLAFDQLTGPPAGPGEAVAVIDAVVPVWIGDQDLRCHMGATPGAPAGEVGRCSGTGSDTCNPESFTPGVDCPSGETCEYCFTSVNQAGICGSNGAACNASADCGGSTCTLPSDYLLPGDYDDGGFPALDLITPSLGGVPHPPRIGMIAERLPDASRPLRITLVTGNAAAEVRDYDVKGLRDFQTLGQSSGGSPGVGAGTSYAAGSSTLPAFPSHVIANNITVPPENAGVPVGKLLRTYEFGPGPDRIAGCVGDSSKLLGDGECNQRLGAAANPGNTGSDDVILGTSIAGCSLTCIGGGDSTGSGERGRPCGPGSELALDGTPGNGEVAGQACDRTPLGGADGSVCGCGGISAAAHRAETFPDKDATYPTQLLVGGATTLDFRMLTALDSDAIFKLRETTCPIVGTCSGGSSSPGAQCSGPDDCPGGACENIALRCADKCDDLGGDPDGDGICSNGDQAGVAGDGACSCPPGSPADCTQGCDDNCPMRPNPDQLDRGGVAALGLGDGGPDGIGDVCQCADMTGDGKVTLADLVQYRRQFGGNPKNTFRADLCSVSGADPLACSSSDLVALRRLFGGASSDFDPRGCYAQTAPFAFE
jgi:hypothetical protein